MVWYETGGKAIEMGSMKHGDIDLRREAELRGQREG